jgi:hypothetical protein
MALAASPTLSSRLSKPFSVAAVRPLPFHVSSSFLRAAAFCASTLLSFSSMALKLASKTMTSRSISLPAMA